MICKLCVQKEGREAGEEGKSVIQKEKDDIRASFCLLKGNT